MRIAALIAEVEARIAAGEAHVYGEVAAFYSGVHAIISAGRLELESEVKALEEIVHRIFHSGGEVPPSSEPVAGEPVSGSQEDSTPVAGPQPAPAVPSEPVPVELHQLADDGNPHHDEVEGKGALVDPPHPHEEGHTENQ